MKRLLPRMAVTTADLQRHTSQLRTETPNPPDAQSIVQELGINMREAAALKNEVVDIVNKQDNTRKVAGLTNDG